MNKKIPFPLSKTDQMKYDRDVFNLYFRKPKMSKQAKTLNQQEIRRVLDYISTRKHAIRNRAILQTSFLAGLRVGEISSLKYRDVVDVEGRVKDQILLTADMTKGSESRIVFISQSLRKELQVYADQYKPENTSQKFFYSQKKTSKDGGFSANSLTQHFHYLYRKAGIEGASSHSGRRTFATNISGAGVGIKVLQKILGHKNIQTTAVYIFASDDMMRKAVELA